MNKLFSSTLLCAGLLGVASATTHAQTQNLFVANLGNTGFGGSVIGSVIGYNTTTGTQAGAFGGIEQPVGLASFGNSLYATSYSTATATSTILRLGANGAVTPAVVSTSASAMMLQNPKEIAFGANASTLYVANGGNLPSANNSYIGVANVNTGSYSQPTNAPAVGFGGNGSALNVPFALAYDGSRYLYAGNLNNTIVRFDTFDTTAQGRMGTALTLTPDTGATIAGVTSIDTLNGLTFGPDGALYATDGTNNDVLRIATPQGAASTFSIFVDGNTGATAALRLDGPEGLIFDPTNSFLYVSNDNNTIKRIPVADVNGTETAGVVTPFVTLPSGSNPGFLAFSPIPEPSTYALLGVAGLALTVGLRRHRQVTLRA